MTDDDIKKSIEELNRQEGRCRQILGSSHDADSRQHARESIEQIRQDRQELQDALKTNQVSRALGRTGYTITDGDLTCHRHDRAWIMDQIQALPPDRARSATIGYTRVYNQVMDDNAGLSSAESLARKIANTRLREYAIKTGAIK